MDFIKYNGQKLPIFNTPLTNAEIQNYREKFDKFLIKDVRLGTIKCISNNIEIKRFRIDFGFRPMVYTTALVLAFYNYIQVKKKIKKKLNIFKGFKKNTDMKDWWNPEVKPNGAKPIEL